MIVMVFIGIVEILMTISKAKLQQTRCIQTSVDVVNGIAPKSTEPEPNSYYLRVKPKKALASTPISDSLIPSPAP